MVIAIDGPSSAGKGTVAKIVAQKLGFSYLDTGAMYRCVALTLKNNEVDINDDTKISEILNNTKIRLSSDNNKSLKVELNGKDVSKEIRTPEISRLSSDIATKISVRSFLTKLQREFAQNSNVVAEGRDMGTQVFPDAYVKFFIDASVEVRTNRRYLQLQQAGIKTDIENLRKDIQNRDYQDKNREIAPLHPAINAVIIDTTNLEIDQVVDIILKRTKGVFD
ncbi:MAG: (d)CMP kinase [Deltaproteobacteria bacterium]|nr:MAG: (d)CMP kinase [Deltaproteobacteria bacterium]TDJ06983.1 MAG: (d)CMP kinase [Deltaproteobacteria bacterium]